MTTSSIKNQNNKIIKIRKMGFTHGQGRLKVFTAEVGSIDLVDRYHMSEIESQTPLINICVKIISIST